MTDAMRQTSENVQEITNRLDQWLSDGRAQLKVLHRDHRETVNEQESTTIMKHSV